MIRGFFKILSVFFVLVVASCARRGTITGGARDTLAPVLLSSIPKNFSTNFVGKQIVLTFDEYVKLKNSEKQLVISPPLKYNPEILPNYASKIITIKIKDTLQNNTTYSFNFGESIEDNNEANKYKQFKYVFSTGTQIDSLKLHVLLKNALEKKDDNFVSVMLYDADESFTDSIIYKKNPRYIGNSLDSLKTVTLENIKPGKYKLVAIKDENKNNKFDAKTEKIGFYKQTISLPNDSIFEVKLFKEVPFFKAVSLSQSSGSKFMLGYEGNAKNAVIKVTKNNAEIPVKVTGLPSKDSLQVWFKASKTDSLKVAVTNGNYSKIFKIKVKDQKKDTLSLKVLSNKLGFRKKLTIESSIPIDKFDVSKIKIIKKDSTEIKFTANYSDFEQQLVFDFIKEPEETYTLKLQPNAIVDFSGNTNKKEKFIATTGAIADYGSLRVTLENVKHFPVIIQLTTADGKVIETEYSNGNKNINFDLIEPNKYTLRTIYDDNKNNVWDAGNYLEKQQSEEVIYFSKELDVRPNWDVDQPFDLKTN